MPLLHRRVVAVVRRLQGLVAGAHHDRRDLEHRAPVGPRGRGKWPIAAMDLVEMVDDGAAVDQRLAIVEHQGRDAAERIGRAHLLAFAEAGNALLPVGHAVSRERDRHPPRVRRAVHSDQQHLRRPGSGGRPRRQSRSSRRSAWRRG